MSEVAQIHCERWIAAHLVPKQCKKLRSCMQTTVDVSVHARWGQLLHWSLAARVMGVVVPLLAAVDAVSYGVHAAISVAVLPFVMHGADRAEDVAHFKAEFLENCSLALRCVAAAVVTAMVAIAGLFIGSYAYRLLDAAADNYDDKTIQLSEIPSQEQALLPLSLPLMAQQESKLFDMFPNEVLRICFEHMSTEQRISVARVAKIWAYLVNSFPIFYVMQHHCVNFSIWHLFSKIFGLKKDTITEDGRVKIYENARAIPPFYQHKKSLVIHAHGIKKGENVISFCERLSNESIINEVDLSLPLVGYRRKETYSDSEFIKIIDLIKTNKKIKILKIRNCTFKETQFKTLANVLNESGLTHLDLTGTMIKYEYEGHGKSVSFGGIIGSLAIEFAEILKVNKSLVSLNLSKCSLGDPEARALAEMLYVNNTLSYLELQGNKLTHVSAKFFLSALVLNSTLTHLDLQSNRIRNAGAGYMAIALKINRSLSYLFLTQNLLTGEGVKEIAEALRENVSLTELDLRANDIGVQGTEHLASALKVNSTLKTLHLLGTMFFDGACITPLAEALQTNESLTILDLSCNVITDKGMEALSVALQQVNSSLKVLLLNNNSINRVKAKLLSAALQKNKKLTELSLQRCDLGSDQMHYLAEALATNTSLTAISLKDNHIGTVGAEKIGEALATNICLRVLYLENNNLNVKSLVNISKGLRDNHSLISLRLCGNNIGNKFNHDDAAIISEALGKNRTLRFLNLAETQMSERHWSKNALFTKALRDNHVLNINWTGP